LNPMAGLAKLKEKTQRAAELEALQGDLPEDVASDAPIADQSKAPVAAKAAKTAKRATRAEPHPLVLDWQSKVDALIALVQEHPDPEESGFMQAASDTIMELLDAVAAPEVLHPDNQWLLGQFQEGLDTVIMMQVESGDDVLEDAAMLLLQLSRDLACIADTAP
jgi:hypothetical protein